ISRAVRIAVSDGRPSRRKKPPGILPAAYMRSSTSTVNGKKSMPSRGFDVVHVASTWVSPRVSTHAPCACRASLPTSTDISAPPPGEGGGAQQRGGGGRVSDEAGGAEQDGARLAPLGRPGVTGRRGVGRTVAGRAVSKFRVFVYRRVPLSVCRQCSVLTSKVA